MRKWTMLLILFPVLAVALQACGPRSKDEPDCGFQKNVYGERISWQDQVPISLQVHSGFPAEFLPALENAIRTWEIVAGRPLFVIQATHAAGPIAPRQDGVNMIYWMPSWESEKSSEQARTTVYFVSNEIREADIRVNAYNYTFYLDQPSEFRQLHLESLLLHELGHVLGLAHRNDSGTVMATTLASSTVRNRVSEMDKESIICEY